jgi:hypothetical protein
MAAILVLSAVSPGPAQESLPPRVEQLNAIILLPQPAVQKDLKMTEEQIQQAKKSLTSRLTVREQLKDLDRDARAKRLEELKQENDKRAAAILTTAQIKRLRQIYLQQQGMNALTKPEVAREMKFTDEQRKQIETLQTQAGAEIQALRGPTSTEETMKKISALTRSFHDEAMKLLTDVQKAKWKELTGKPFKGELRLTMPGQRSKPD